MVKNMISVPGVYQDFKKYIFLKVTKQVAHLAYPLEQGQISPGVQNMIEPDEEDKDYGSQYIPCH